jgi:hypothetical protein
MATTTWTIAQLERNTSDGGVTVVHWRVSAVDGDYTASSYGTVGCTPDPEAADWIAFDALTEADVLAWVWASVDKDTTEASLAAQIDADKAPTSATGMPGWNNFNQRRSQWLRNKHKPLRSTT